jgi:hypothetical protein
MSNEFKNDCTVRDIRDFLDFIDGSIFSCLYISHSIICYHLHVT